MRPSTWIIASSALATLACAVPLTSCASASGSGGVQPMSAYSVINAVGVDTHMHYNDTGYVNATTVTNLLTGLGVRHVRDSVDLGAPAEVAAFQQLASAGIDLTLLTGAPSATGSQTVDSRNIAELDQLAPHVDGIESPNEYDCSGDSSWVAHLRAYDNALASAVSADNALQSIPRLSPSFCDGGNAAAYGPVGDAANVVNLHDYSGGSAPEAAIEARVAAASAAGGSNLPVEITETGYTNALADSAPAQPAVTELTAADYDLRLLLDADRIGVKRTYLYELLDEFANPDLTNAEEHFGLVDNDGTVKPAYTAIKAMLADIAQGSPSAVQSSGSPSSLPLQIQGGGGLLRSLVVGDPSGGGATVALWLAEPLEDTSSHAALPDRSTSVHLALGDAYSASSRQPSRGNASTTLGTGEAFDVPVDGAVTLVHLSPSATTTTSPCTATNGYAETAAADGAVLTSSLDPTTTTWTGQPTADSSAPDAVGAGVQVAGSSQLAHLAVPGSPSDWTIGVWERTDPGSAGIATFLHATGLPGAQLRTYDLTSDQASHDQVSGYGLPTGSASYGSELYGRALIGGWHFLTLTDSGATTTLAVDGVAQGSVASSGAGLSGLDVGAVSSGFRGSLAGHSVFPSALSSSQQLALATAESSPCTTSTASPSASPSASASATVAPGSTPPVTPTTIPTSATPTTAMPTTAMPTATTVAGSGSGGSSDGGGTDVAMTASADPTTASATPTVSATPRHVTAKMAIAILVTIHHRHVAKAALRNQLVSAVTSRLSCESRVASVSASAAEAHAVIPTTCGRSNASLHHAVHAAVRKHRSWHVSLRSVRRAHAHALVARHRQAPAAAAPGSDQVLARSLQQLGLGGPDSPVAVMVDGVGPQA